VAIKTADEIHNEYVNSSHYAYLGTKDKLLLEITMQIAELNGLLRKTLFVNESKLTKTAESEPTLVIPSKEKLQK
jgi:hypothetical protein